MQPSLFIPIIIIFIFLYVAVRNRKAVIIRKLIRKRKQEGNTQMVELAKKFIGKECLVCAFDSSHQFQGIIKEVSNGAILIEKSGAVEAINLDFVIRIKEYPKNKKGKKKALVLD